jgi:hypothetical protein
MPGVTEAIEEMVEESYLLGLSEDEIRQNFLRFIDTCHAVVRTHVRDRAAGSGLAERLAREKTLLQIADRAQAARGSSAVAEGPGVPVPEAADGFAERVARRKRVVLRTIGAFDPRLVRLIDERRFQAGTGPSQGSGPRRPDWRQAWARYRLHLLRVGYAVTVLLIAFLFYMGYAQSR